MDKMSQMFIPKRQSLGPTSPVSPHERIGAEERKRAMLEDNPGEFRNESKFGPIDGIPVFKTWSTRDECARDGVHAPSTAGIWGGKDGAYSIVMSGGYEDDHDRGETILYTGTGGFGEEKKFGGGGNSWGRNIQTEDQTFEHRDNKALRISFELGKPVRVIRGSNLQTVYAPPDGYRYDGLYKVTKAYMDKSKDGLYEVCRFELKREPGQPPIRKRVYY
ncbi:PUA-like domain-containing protein [Thelephora terrestris]|uniref:PUA-like domain-containing protein n=1 Tax=Thelephora terrestris TaxID=56493 RepID=A0A9P6HGJ9_9AGAM|nr:PUA-like domain-containing protein [Thelephora terrestris]